MDQWNEFSSAPPSAFFYWRAIERQSRGKKSKREKSNYFSKKFAARGNYFHVRVYFITVQRNFHSFFLLLGGKVDDDGVAQSESNKCLQIFSLSPFSNQSDFLVFTLFSRYNAFLWAFTHAHVQKNPRVFMSSLKLFHFHVMPHKNFSTAILNSNHVGGLN